MKHKTILRVTYNAIIFLLLAGGAYLVIDHFVHFGNVEFTDNAAVRQHITPVNTRVQGFIKEIRFEEFQPVHKGDTLLIIEDSEFRLRLAQAEADLANALAGKQATSQGMNTTETDMLVTDASIEEARVQLENARREEARYAQLLRDDAATQQQYYNVNTAYLAAKARYELLSRRKQTLASTRTEQGHRLNQNAAAIELARAAVDLARLNLSYTVRASGRAACSRSAGCALCVGTPTNSSPWGWRSSRSTPPVSISLPTVRSTAKPCACRSCFAAFPTPC